jgi:tetratricopeptide (TPR) repeat protein
MPAELEDFDELWDYEHPEEPERRLRAALASAGAAAPSYRAQLLTQVARAQGLQRRFGDAHHTLDQADALLGEGDARPLIRSRLERGRVFNSSGDPDRARPLFREAWDLARAAGEDFFAIDAAHMLGIVERGAAGLEWTQTALELAEQTARPRAAGWRGSLCNNLGWGYHDLGRFEDALRMFERTLAWEQAQGRVGRALSAKWCIARTLRSLGRTEEALARQTALLGEYQAAGRTSGYVEEEIGECLLALGRAGEARPHFATGSAELSKDSWFAANEPVRLERLRRLAES